MDLFIWFNDLLSFNVIIEIICVTILASLSFGVVFASSETLDYPNVLNALLSFSLFLLVLLVFLFGSDFDSVSLSLYFFNQHFQFLLIFSSIFVVLVTRDFVSARKITKFEYDSLLLFMVLSVICLCFVDDLLLFYLAIELQSLCFYVFATFNRTSEFSTESGLKYFVFGAIISCFLLFGFAVIYFTFGLVSFEALMSLMQTMPDFSLLFGFLFVLIALLFKVGAAPFHS
jgi:NADH:ubiquinone oxidoreductase subunit 2 (subunit N)